MTKVGSLSDVAQVPFLGAGQISLPLGVRLISITTNTQLMSINRFVRLFVLTLYCNLHFTRSFFFGVASNGQRVDFTVCPIHSQERDRCVRICYIRC